MILFSIIGLKEVFFLMKKQKAIDFILKYEKTTGHKLVTILLRLENWYYFLLRSYKDVIDNTEYFEKTGKYDPKEYYRLVFNYLNAETGITNKVIGWRNHLHNEIMVNIIIDDDYQLNLEKFGVHKYKEFIKELRNNYHHKASKENFGIAFTSVLEDGKRISSKVEFIFLTNDGVKIMDLKEVIVSHTDSVVNFYEWFVKKIKSSINSEEYDKYLDCLKIAKG